MSLQQIRASQVKGINSDNLQSDIIDITQKAMTYDRPVATKNLLPTTGNQDGDVRLVLDEDIFYIWDEPTTSWIAKTDKRTESRTSDILIEVDGQENFTTDLLVGVDGGIASLGTINLSVNGVSQSSKDYSLGVTGQVPPRLIITWKSTDFLLETTDILTVVYDILLID